MELIIKSNFVGSDGSKHEIELDVQGNMARVVVADVCVLVSPEDAAVLGEALKQFSTRNN